MYISLHPFKSAYGQLYSIGQEITDAEYALLHRSDKPFFKKKKEESSNRF